TNPTNLVPVAVLDDDQDVRGRLALQLGERAAPVESVASLEQMLVGAPHVLVLGPSFANPASLAEINGTLQAHREIGTILIAEELSTDLLQTALRSGVKDVLAAPVDTDQLVAAVDRVTAALDLGSLAQVASTTSSAPAGAVPGEQGKVVTVFSTKGGAGKSMLAANLAVILAKRSDKPVVLVDADLQFGDVAVMLKLAPQHTIVDAVGSLDRLDATLLQQFLMRHEPSGLLILPAPLEPSFADQISAAEMVKIVELLRTFCSFVVIDTPAYFNEVVLGLIEESDEVLLIAGMDIPNIKNVKIGLQTLRLLNVPMTKLHLVLNRANSKVKLDVSEVERTLQIKAESLIPSDVVVPQSVNKGTPVVLDSPKSGVAKSIEQLANMFLAADDSGRRRR
ncbi:MAG: AAA family ATPase, partial [Acidimicrobiales bacterium]